MLIFVANTEPIASTDTLLGSMLSLAMAGSPSFSAIFSEGCRKSGKKMSTPYTFSYCCFCFVSPSSFFLSSLMAVSILTYYTAPCCLESKHFIFVFIILYKIFWGKKGPIWPKWEEPRRPKFTLTSRGHGFTILGPKNMFQTPYPLLSNVL